MMRWWLILSLVLLTLPGWTQPVLVPTPTQPSAPHVIWTDYEGLRLFKVCSLPSISAEERASRLRNRLDQILQDPGVLEDPEARSRVAIETLDGTTVLTCRGSYLISVTDQDALANETTVALLAETWQQTLQDKLSRMAAERSGHFFQGAVTGTAVALLLGLLINLMIRTVAVRYFNTPGLSLRALTWLLVVTYILYQFPNTRGLSNAMLRYAVKPLGLLLLVIAGGVFVSFVTTRLLGHYFTTTERIRSRLPQSSPRWQQRLAMVRQVTIFCGNAVVAVLCLVIYLSLLEVNLGAVLAGAGFIGVGLGLAAQDLLKDWMSGVNIVLEDQFGAGDLISTGDHEGVVENFTLRITQLRDIDGCLITVPNSNIRIVRNQSKLWSQVDLRIPVSYQTDLRRALELLRATARKLREDWPEKIVQEPVVLGVDEFGPYSIWIRVLVRTAPQEQFAVKRELLLRLREAFAQEGLEIPVQKMQVELTGTAPRPEI